MVAQCTADGQLEGRVKRFADWMAQNGVYLNEKLGIRSLEGYGLSIVADRAIGEKEKLIDVPIEVTMSASGIAKHIPKKISETLKSLSISKTDEQALYLIYTRLNPDSFWNPYVDLLPTTFTTTLYFTDAELEELQASPLKQYSIDRKMGVDDHYEIVVERLSDKLADFGLGAESITRELFYWALTCVWSRSFSLSKTDGGMIPLADLFNALPVDQSKIATRSSPTSGLQYFAKGSIAPGEQVFTPYGVQKPLSSAQMLMDYGFVFPDAMKPLKSSEKVILRVPRFSEDDDFFAVQRDILVSSGVESDEFALDISQTRSMDTLPWDLMLYARVKNLAEPELEEAPGHFKSKRYRNTAISERNEKASLRFLQIVVKKHLDHYETTLEEDVELLQTAPSLNTANAIKIRIIEKEIFNSLLQLLVKLRKEFK